MTEECDTLKSAACFVRREIFNFIDILYNSKKAKAGACRQYNLNKIIFRDENAS
jgi:hypothetical protein